jgi:citronellyl-CoA synthetase
VTGLSEVLFMAKALYRGATMKQYDRESAENLGTLLTRQASLRGDAPALTCEGETISWREFESRANRVAQYLSHHQGIEKGDAVALMLENRVAFLTSLFGICKLGAVAGLLNTNQRGPVLLHSVQTIEAKALLVGEECLDAIAEIEAELPMDPSARLVVPDRGEAALPGWVQPFDDRDETHPDTVPPAQATVLHKDPCFFVFTSGTTGLPKAAVLSNERCFKGMQGYGVVCLNIQPEDRVYNCLPLYHSTGLVIGLGSVLWAGASTVLRRRFSASNFLKEVREQRCNTFVYVGELCRYLMNQPAQADDADNPLEKMIGNGLRPDIWKPFKARFGVPRVHEIYGASEGNSGFVNAFNKDETIGFGVTPHVLVKYDDEEDEIIRDPHGMCIPVPRGQPGLLLNKIDAKAPFDGYTDKAASAKKVVHNVVTGGDRYFNTGDLIREVDVGFAFWQRHYQFVDRTGDTFRWKGENCSTNEVGEQLNGFDAIASANVYGVEIPGTNGRAGMAALILKGDSLDLDAFSAHVEGALPSYARPIFLRVQHDQETTSTFKLVKKTLREEGFDPDQVGSDSLYVMKPGNATYEPLSCEYFEIIQRGEAGF